MVEVDHDKFYWKADPSAEHMFAPTDWPEQPLAEDLAALVLRNIQRLICYEEMKMETMGESQGPGWEKHLANLFVVREQTERMIAAFMDEGR